MAVLVHKCPHCMADRMTMAVTPGASIKNDLWPVLLFCTACEKPSAALIRTSLHALSTNGEIVKTGGIVLGVWPHPPEPSVPDHLPDDIARAYLQGERNFAQPEMEESAAGMYGRALDLALKTVIPDMPRANLDKRIRKAVDQGHLLPALGDWADEIRLFRNDALHEADGVTRADLTQIRAFLELFMRSVFTLPKTLEIRRAETKPASAG